MSTLNSNSISIQPLQSTTDLTSFKKAQLQTLSAPLDGYWETAVIGSAPHYEIRQNDALLGYCVISEEKELRQFFVFTENDSGKILKQLIATGQVNTAVAGTNDPSFLANCFKLTNNFTITVNTYLFQDDQMPDLPSLPQNAVLRLAQLDDLERLANFYGRNNEYEDADAIEANSGDRLNYAQALIENEQVFLLTDEVVIFGIGECRFSQTQPSFADVGMIVDKLHRRQNLGTTLLIHLKKHCYDNGRKPICSCAAENVASRKTIKKAGFINTDRILNIPFK